VAEANCDEHPGLGKGLERSEGRVAVVTGHAMVIDGGQTIDA
jgi:hypothetical protein